MEIQKAHWQLHSVHDAIFQGSLLRFNHFDGTGDTMAKRVNKIVINFELPNSLPSLVFDIITSNIDHWKCIWAHFRTTIALISSYTRAIIKYAKIAIHRETKGLDDPLFKQLKRFFGFIELDKRAL